MSVKAHRGAEFTGRLFNREKHASGEHELDKLCATLGIEHQLSPPRHPQINKMIERFNGGISEVLATHRCEPGQDLAQMLERYVLLYNPHLPQQRLQH